MNFTTVLCGIYGEVRYKYHGNTEKSTAHNRRIDRENKPT